MQLAQEMKLSLWLIPTLLKSTVSEISPSPCCPSDIVGEVRCLLPHTGF